MSELGESIVSACRGVWEDIRQRAAIIFAWTVVWVGALWGLASFFMDKAEAWWILYDLGEPGALAGCILWGGAGILLAVIFQSFLAYSLFGMSYRTVCLREPGGNFLDGVQGILHPKRALLLFGAAVAGVDIAAGIILWAADFGETAAHVVAHLVIFALLFFLFSRFSFAWPIHMANLRVGVWECYRRAWRKMRGERRRVMPALLLAACVLFLISLGMHAVDGVMSESRRIEIEMIGVARQIQAQTAGDVQYLERAAQKRQDTGDGIDFDRLKQWEVFSGKAPLYSDFDDFDEFLATYAKYASEIDGFYARREFREPSSVTLRYRTHMGASMRWYFLEFLLFLCGAAVIAFVAAFLARAYRESEEEESSRLLRAPTAPKMDENADMPQKNAENAKSISEDAEHAKESKKSEQTSEDAQKPESAAPMADGAGGAGKAAVRSGVPDEIDPGFELKF